MAEDCINQAANLAGLPERECLTRSLKIHQSPAGRGEKLDERFSYTLEDVVRTVREEMARTVEDVLARRLRILFLNARAAIEVAPTVAALMAAELGRDEAWQLEQVQSFNEIAKNYLVGNIKGQQ
jgi:glycerol-3-phosphate dehydrogenase